MAEIALHKEKDSCFVAVPQRFITEYMPRANGEFVKVYLCLLQAFQQEDATLSTDTLADRLSCTEGDILRAFHYWEAQGLLSLTMEKGRPAALSLCQEASGDLSSRTSSAVKPANAAIPQVTEVEETIPPKPEQLSPNRLKQLKNDEEFAQLLYITESYIGKPLKPSEITSLDYYYETLHFPVELIEYLVEYCVSKGHKSFHYIESVALGWHEEGIRTIEQAKQQSSQYTQQYYSVLKAFGVTGRSPIEQEIRMIDHWMKDYGFDTELICEACSRTIQQINKVSFAYADTILTNWKNLNVRTRKDIEAADAVHESRRQSQKAAQEKPKTANTRATQSRFNNFKQRQYDYQKLEQQLLSAGKKE